MPRPGEIHDKTGLRFGRLTVLALVGRSAARHSIWRCRCDCGREVDVLSCNLATSKSLSCGCLKDETVLVRSTSHGQATGRGTPTYRSWMAMLARVRSTTGRRFRDYGSRGITVCERWKVFENFLADMGPRPADTRPRPHQQRRQLRAWQLPLGDREPAGREPSTPST